MRAQAAGGARRGARPACCAGKEEYLLARDKGPERALVRDIVDSRRTVGTFFFGGALIVLIGSSGAMPPTVQARREPVLGPARARRGGRQLPAHPQDQAADPGALPEGDQAT